MKDMTTWTHDVNDIEDLLGRLRRCDGKNSDSAVIVWEQCQAIAEEIAVLREQLNVATTRAQRFYDCLMRLAIRANDYGFLDIWANIADALKISVKELEQILEAS